MSLKYSRELFILVIYAVRLSFFQECVAFPLVSECFVKLLLVKLIQEARADLLLELPKCQLLTEKKKTEEFVNYLTFLNSDLIPGNAGWASLQ